MIEKRSDKLKKMKKLSPLYKDKMKKKINITKDIQYKTKQAN